MADTLANILANFGYRPDVMPIGEVQSRLRNNLADRQQQAQSPGILERATVDPYAPFDKTQRPDQVTATPERRPGQDAVDAVMFLANFLGPKVPRPGNITAYHGSPHDFDQFVTPAFFASKEGIAKQYRREGGGQDNLNGLGGFNTPEGWYQAHGALDQAGQDKAKAIAILEQEIAGLSPETLAPHYQHHMQRGPIDKLLGLRGTLDPGFQRWAQGYAADKQAAIDFLHSGAPAGKLYEVQMPEPTAHYDGNQKSDIADAMAKGHKVITWGGSMPSGGEIVGLDPNVIEILRKYGIVGSAGAGASLANVLSQDSPQSP